MCVHTSVVPPLNTRGKVRGCHLESRAPYGQGKQSLQHWPCINLINMNEFITYAVGGVEQRNVKFFSMCCTLFNSLRTSACRVGTWRVSRFRESENLVFNIKVLFVVFFYCWVSLQLQAVFVTERLRSSDALQVFCVAIWRKERDKAQS